MLPGQIGLLILGLTSAFILALMGFFSYKTHKKDEALKARRARREKLRQQAAQQEKPKQTDFSVPAAPENNAPFFGDAPSGPDASPAQKEVSFTSPGDLDWSFLEDIPSVSDDSASHDRVRGSAEDDDPPPVSFDFKF